MVAVANGESDSETVEVSLRFSKEDYERLMALKAVVEAENLGEILSEACRLYEAAVGEAESGATFFIKRKGNRSPVPYNIF